MRPRGAEALLVQVVSAMQRAEQEGEVEQIAAAGVPFAMVEVPVEDWELELMPWAVWPGSSHGA
ncbi:MAG: hypothetical protein IJ524_05445 [Bacteroidales bacterium]|nr:hypothetical protein [Bacteroidales bacterium]